MIGADCKTTQNFSQAENWVVLECVDRLLEKGYKPQNIILEKTFWDFCIFPIFAADFQQERKREMLSALY